MDAVQHITRFSKNTNAVGRLQAVLEDRRAGRIQELAADGCLTDRRG